MEVYGAVAHAWPDLAQGLEQVGTEVDTGTNADLLLRRLLVDGDDALALKHLCAVAKACNQVPTGLLDMVHRRRAAAMSALAHGDVVARAVVITPEWRVVVGHGEDSALETSLTLSPTYGVPLFPGSAVKGLAVAQARASGTRQEDLERLFGSPRPGDDAEDARQGSVVLFDAMPIEPPQVVVDVLTPHVKPYYDSGNTNGTPTEQPAEYHNPVPIHFLAVAGKRFRTLLLGPSDDVATVAELACRALDELGIGGKTAAGYGYCGAKITEDLR